MASEGPDVPTVLLVNDEYGTRKGGISTINCQLAQVLVDAGARVSCTVLRAPEEDLECAKKNGVQLIHPDTRGKKEAPTLDWLTDYHYHHYPNLPKDISCIIGHADITDKAAKSIKDERYPQADLLTFTHVIPEDTEYYKGGQTAMKAREKEKNMAKAVHKAKAAFSVGKRIYDHFDTIYKGKLKPRDHHIFLPKPSKLFLSATVKPGGAQKVVLSIGRVRKVERLKGHDLAGQALRQVVKKIDNVRWCVRGISEDDYETSQKILEDNLNSPDLNPTLLPYGTQEDILDDMTKAHLVVMSSRSEPFGLVGLEAIAAGIPVLISDKTGLAVMIKGLIDDGKLHPEHRQVIVETSVNDFNPEKDAKRWAEKIVDVLKYSDSEFEKAARFKRELVESRYWEEFHQTFLRACGIMGGAAVLSPVPLPTEAPPNRVTMQADEIQRAVKRYYELKLSYIKPLIWNDDFTLNLSDIFTKLELIPREEKQRKIYTDNVWSGQGKNLSSLDDLFNRDITGRSIAPRCILIEGEAGGGKTTFLSRETLDAVSKTTELGRRHDIVLLIRLREVTEGETIEEMVLDQCIPETIAGIDVQSIRAILQRNESRVLFLLDGYDELRPEARSAGQAISKLLSGKMYPNSTIVITSRPSAGVQQYTQPDCHINITGFSEEHVEQYVQRYFSIMGKPDQAKVLLTALKENQLAMDLIHIPIFLLYVCILWDETEMGTIGLTGTMTGLYSNLLTDMGRKYCKREGVDMPTDRLPAEVADALLQLGKLALEALLRNETMIDFTEVKKANMNEELLLKLGVVSKEMSASKRHPRKQLNFSHKTMQEFLAGRYVAHAVVNKDIVELLQLTSVSKALELSNLLQFTCGRDSRAAQAVLEGLRYLRGKEFPDEKIKTLCASYSSLDESEKVKSAETYKQFVLLCLDILNERKEPDLLQAVCRALPVIIMDIGGHRKHPAGLKYYLEIIQSSHLQDRMILAVYGDNALHNLEQMFSSPIHALRLDLILQHLLLGSPDQTARLVSVLKNVPGLRALKLSGTHLTPSSLRPLVRGFSHMSLLEELDLSKNPNLGDAGMEVLQSGLSSVPHLAVISIGYVGMTAVGMSTLRHPGGLRGLDISNNEIGDAGLESLTAVLPTFTAMQVLVLTRTGISSTGMRTLVPALCQLTRLLKLVISHNAIFDPWLECLADILPRLTAMKVLKLKMTGISDRGISALVRALPHLVELQVLDVSYNNIGDSEIVSLVQTLCQPSSLDTEKNPPVDKSQTTAPHYNTTLRELRIGGNRGVTGAGLGRVAQLISALPALTVLHMSGSYPRTHLSDTAAMALAEALPRLPALERLELWHISMEPAGFQAVMQAAEEHPTLETLRYDMLWRVPEGADTSASCLR